VVENPSAKVSQRRPPQGATSLCGSMARGLHPNLQCNLGLGNCLCGQRHGLAMNWVDQPRTSVDERMLSWRRAVVILLWAVAGLIVPH